jgi:glutaredoxin
MNVLIFTSKTCPICNHLKTLLKRADLEWKEYVIGDDISFQSFKYKYPNVNKTPFVIIDGEKYHTIHEVAKFLLDLGLVSSSL